MKIIFIGTTGVHHSLVAANLFVNQGIPYNLNQIPGFADNNQDHRGLPIFVGHDDRGNEVYSLGAGRNVLMAKKTIDELVGVLGFYPHDLLVKPIKVWGDSLFPFINKVSSIAGAESIGKMVARYLDSYQLNNIKHQVEGFQDHYQLH